MASWPETKPLSEANLSELVDRIIQAENNINAGKSAIVDAILDMNQNATIGMTHTQLAALIRSISNDANAALSDVLSGRTFYQGGQKRTGTLSLTGNANDDDVLSGRTYYNTNAKSKRTGTLSLTGNATASQVLSGRTFYSNNPKSRQTGTMANRSGHVNAQSRSRSGTTLRLRPPQGYFDGSTSNSVQYNDPNWVAQNIPQGISIFGLSGSLIVGKKIATGEFSIGSNQYREVTGLAFTPRLVLNLRYDSNFRGLSVLTNIPELGIGAIGINSGNTINGLPDFDTNTYVTSGGFRFYAYSGTNKWIAVE